MLKNKTTATANLHLTSWGVTFLYIVFFSNKHAQRRPGVATATSPSIALLIQIKLHGDSFLISLNPTYYSQLPFCFTLHRHLTLTQFLPPAAFIFLNSIKFLSNGIFLNVLLIYPQNSLNIILNIFLYPKSNCFCLERPSSYASAEMLCISQDLSIIHSVNSLFSLHQNSVLFLCASVALSKIFHLLTFVVVFS